MDVEINFKLSAGKNADNKYKLKQKFEKKIKGLDIAIENTKKKLEILNKNIDTKKENINFKKIENKSYEWYEKFRWFFTFNNNLVIGGKDSKNNEVVVKKHMTDNDLYFHADINGAPHIVLKNINEFDKEEKKECAIFAASYSSAWKSKIFSVDVYSVKSDQVSKSANTGESLGKGAFVIRGKREYFRNTELKLVIGYNENLKKIMCGPLRSIQKNCKTYFTIIPGDTKKSDIAKLLKIKFEKKEILVSLDNLISILPSGDSSIIN
jgi:predicted ribosome quality control (RQC) complex YloA/Tae2 family protein